ncbi:MAG: D-glucuronyl C5-epimerase family protein [Terriglobales bacterium]
MGSRVITADVQPKRPFAAGAAARWQYYRRIVPAYLGSGRSQLTFWHETPELSAPVVPDAIDANRRLGLYYMAFREKADYAGAHDPGGIPMLDYRGAIGLQYNPIAIAQWGLANYNRYCETSDATRLAKTLKSADWLVANLERNAHGLWVWNHHFDWEYRSTLRAPWYSGLAQGQGISLLLRAHAETGTETYLHAAETAFATLTRPICEGGVLFEDANGDLWIEEYLVDPPTHILNGFMWALWGVFDFWLACGDDSAKKLFDRGVSTLLRNLSSYDTGYWSLYEQSGTRLKMLASPFYHRLHIVQLHVMANLTGDRRFSDVAARWEDYSRRRPNRTRALVEKCMFKLLHY